MRRHHIIVLSFIFLSLFYISAHTAHAQNGPFKVGTDSLKVREEPFGQAAEIGLLSRDSEVNVFEIKHGWAKIEYQGQTGWVASHYLYELSAKSVTVVADEVRLRSNPDTNSSIVGHTSFGETFQLIESKGDWNHIRLNDGSSAWIAGWLVSSEGKNIEQPKDSAILQGRTIILDAGHGGQDPGAIGLGGVLEKDLNLHTARKVQNKLQNAGAKVIMTRSGDENIPLHERTHLSQAFPSAIFISLHHNAHINSSAHGINTFYHHPSAQTLSNAIQNQLDNQTSLRDNGVHFGNYFVLRNNNQNSILIELGFVTNSNDLMTVQSESYQNQVGDAIVQGLIDYLG